MASAEPLVYWFRVGAFALTAPASFFGVLGSDAPELGLRRHGRLSCKHSAPCCPMESRVLTRDWVGIGVGTRSLVLPSISGASAAASGNRPAAMVSLSTSGLSLKGICPMSWPVSARSTIAPFRASAPSPTIGVADRGPECVHAPNAAWGIGRVSNEGPIFCRSGRLILRNSTC